MIQLEETIEEIQITNQLVIKKEIIGKWKTEIHSYYSEEKETWITIRKDLYQMIKKSKKQIK